MSAIIFFIVFVWAVKSAADKVRGEYRATRDHHAASLAREHKDWHPKRIQRAAGRRAQSYWWHEFTHNDGRKWQPFPSFRAAFGEDMLTARVAAAEAHASGISRRKELTERLAAAKAARDAHGVPFESAVPPLPADTVGGTTGSTPEDPPLPGSFPRPGEPWPPGHQAGDARPDDSAWLRPGERRCPKCGGAGCDWCRGWGSDDPDPGAPEAPAGTICGACGRPGTEHDPVLRDGPSRIHRSHAIEAAEGRKADDAADWAQYGPGDPFPEPADDDWPTGQPRRDQHNGARTPLATVTDISPTATEGKPVTQTTEPDTSLEGADTPHEAMQGVFGQFAEQAQRTADAAGDDLTAAAAVHGYDRDPQVMADIADISDQASALSERAKQAREGLRQRHAEGAEYHANGQDAHASAFRPA